MKGDKNECNIRHIIYNTVFNVYSYTILWYKSFTNIYEETVMGKIKTHIQDWLEEYGYNLGYDMANIPELEDLDIVANDDIDAETYWKIRKKEMKDE